LEHRFGETNIGIRMLTNTESIIRKNEKGLRSVKEFSIIDLCEKMDNVMRMYVEKFMNEPMLELDTESWKRCYEREFLKMPLLVMDTDEHRRCYERKFLQKSFWVSGTDSDRARYDEECLKVPMLKFDIE
jgi:hypothetical protein